MTNLDRENTEFHNRLHEVTDYDVTRISDQESAQVFVNKIVNLVEFIETSPYYSKLVEKITANKKLASAESDLTDLGNKILEASKPLLEKLEEFIEQKNIALPNPEEVFKRLSPGVAGSLGLETTASLQMNNIKGILATDAKPTLQNIKGLIHEFRHIGWDLHDMGYDYPLKEEDYTALKKLTTSFEQKLDMYHRLKDQVGTLNYEAIRAIWEHETGKKTANGYVFAFGPLGSFKRNPHEGGYTIPKVQSQAAHYKDLCNTFSGRLQEAAVSYSGLLSQRLKRLVSGFISSIVQAFTNQVVQWIAVFIFGFLSHSLYEWFKHGHHF